HLSSMDAASPGGAGEPVREEPRSGTWACAARSLQRWLLADAEAKDGDGSVPRAAERFQVDPRQTRGGVEPDAVAEQHRQDIHEDLVHETPPQALTGHISTEDFEVLAARSVQCRGDRFPDVTGE